MAKYFTRWEEPNDVVNTRVIGWTARGASMGDTNVGRPRNYSTAPIQKRVVRIVGRTVGCTSWDKPGNLADVKILAALFYSKSTALEHHIIVRGQGAADVDPTDCYRLKFASTAIALGKRVAGVESSTPLFASYALDATKDYFIRFEVSGTSFKVRIWPIGEDEPTTWIIDGTEGTITAAGWLGFCATLNQTSIWNFLSVATGSDEPPKPLTHLEYLAWLDDQTKQREVLAELATVGFSVAQPSRTKDIRVYLSRGIQNGGYTTQAWDSPPLRNYVAGLKSIPQVDEAMPVALRGPVSVAYGELVVPNPSGVRDEWLRRKWKRASLRVRIGDPSWPLHDFRDLFVGQVRDQPQKRGSGSDASIVFPLADISDLFDVPVRTDTVGGSGAFANALSPMVLSGVKYFQPIPYGTSGNQFRVQKGTGVYIEAHANSTTDDFGDVLDAFVSRRATRTVSAVDTATERITTSTAHGAQIDYRVFFRTGTPPAPLALNTQYWVRAIPSSTQLEVSLTRGGAAINLTSADTGATFEVIGWWYDFSANVLTLPGSIVGPVWVKEAQQYVQNSSMPTLNDAAAMMHWLLYDQINASENYKDEDAWADYDALVTGACGLFVGTEPINGLPLFGRMVEETNSYYSQSPEGHIAPGRIDLPAATAIMSFTEADIIPDSLVLERRIMPMDRPSCEVRYATRHSTQGQPQTVNDEYAAPYSVATRLTAPSAVTPLDNHVDEAVNFPPFTTCFLSSATADAEEARLATLYKLPLGIFSFEVAKLSPMALRIGQTLELTHSRLGWKRYTAIDPPSADHRGPFDATKAVLLSRRLVVSSDPTKASTVRLTVIRPIPGQYLEDSEEIPAWLQDWNFSKGTALPESRDIPVSFTRSTARTFVDFEGLVRKAIAGELAIQGLRRARNVLTNSTSFANAQWQKLNGATATDSTITFVNNNSYVQQNCADAFLAPGEVFRWTVSLSAPTTQTLALRVTDQIDGSPDVTTAITIGPTAKRFSILASMGAGFSGQVAAIIQGNGTITAGTVVTATDPMLEVVTGQANQNPSEYVSVGGNAVISNKLNVVIRSEELDNAGGWAPTALMTIGANQRADSRGRMILEKLVPTAVDAQHYMSSALVNHPTGQQHTIEFEAAATGYDTFELYITTATFTDYNGRRFDLANGTTSAALSGGAFTLDAYSITSLGGGLYRCSLTVTAVGQSTVMAAIYVKSAQPTYVGDGVSGIYLGKCQWNGGAVANDYFPVGNVYPYHGAFVDGVKYFPYQNGNTVASNVVTEAEGAPINFVVTNVREIGYHEDIAATNHIAAVATAAVRDLTNAAWVKTNCTPLKDQVGEDGITSSASKLTATAGNATCLLTLTLASAERSYAPSIKRITGTGNIEITIDNGATWSTVPGLEAGGWVRQKVTQTLANPIVGIRIVTNGDAIAVDWNQCEDGSIVTSRIADSGSTRAADVLSFPRFGVLERSRGVALAEVQRLDLGNGVLPILYDATRTFLDLQSNGNGRFSDGTNNVDTTNSAASDQVLRKLLAQWEGSAAKVAVHGGTPIAGSFDGDYGGADTLQVGNGVPMVVQRLRFSDQPLIDEQIIEVTS